MLQRDAMIDAMVSSLADGMGEKELVQFFHEKMTEYYLGLQDPALFNEAENLGLSVEDFYE